MNDRILQTIRTTWPIVIALAGIIVWGARIENQVAQKADREAILRMEGTLGNVNVRVERVERMLSRVICSTNPNDTSCP